MIDFSPRPGSAPAWRRILSHARTETMLLVRNGEQLLVALVIPVALLLGGHLLAPRLGISFNQTAPSVLALAIWSTAFTSTAIATGFERRYGVLERLAATPLGRGGLIAGKALAVVVVTAGQLLLLTGLALALGWRVRAGWTQAGVAMFTTVCSVACFASLALVLAGRLRAELCLALANLIHLVVAGGGALLIAREGYPSGWEQIVAFTPTSALGESLRALSQRHVTLFSLPISLLWALGSMALARKAFRWTS